ncbi:MAG: alcohol dehydrogenase [Paenibacillaceae bacterium ZCTH02-B3]|nr:MAG: alcohol dehydrogenase [Paenibacillaceae bacterium ZCTH02-B3]
MKSNWEFFTSGRIVFGTGSLRKLAPALREMNAKNVLVVTDPGIVRAGLAEKALELMEPFDVIVYDRVIPEPPADSVLDCCRFAAGRNIDAVIGFGGGSSIDMAKMAAALLKYGGHPLDYFGGGNRIPGPITPVIAIPTTAGTGSEATSVAVLTDTANNVKIGISDRHLVPALSIVDPELTLGLPPYVTACTGMDALAHAIEAYTAKPYNDYPPDEDLIFQGSAPISDALALRAIELIADNLAAAVRFGGNLEARSRMMLGSTLAGMAFANAGTALAHAFGYPIGGLVKRPHGEITGLMLPYVMAYNASVQPEKMRTVARLFGVNPAGLSGKEFALSAARAVFRLLAEIGLPTRLGQIGIEAKHIPEIAEKTLGIGRLVRNNPRTPNREDLEKLLNQALRGELA